MPAYVVDKAEGATRLADLQKSLRAEREEAAVYIRRIFRPVPPATGCLALLPRSIIR